MVGAESDVFNADVGGAELFTKLWLRASHSNAFNFRASAELTVTATTHQVQITSDSNEASVATAADNFRDLATVEAEPLRCVERLLVLVAELAILAVAPSVSIASAVEVS